MAKPKVKKSPTFRRRARPTGSKWTEFCQGYREQLESVVDTGNAVMVDLKEAGRIYNGELETEEGKRAFVTNFSQQIKKHSGIDMDVYALSVRIDQDGDVVILCTSRDESEVEEVEEDDIEE